MLSCRQTGLRLWCAREPRGRKPNRLAVNPFLCTTLTRHVKRGRLYRGWRERHLIGKPVCCWGAQVVNKTGELLKTVMGFNTTYG